MKNWLIKKLGGYGNALEAIEEIVSEEERNKILTLAVKKLYNTISSEDILKRREDGGWTYRGRLLEPEKVKRLQAEATSLENFLLWEILQNEIKYLINKKMYLESRDIIDLTAGKLWMYTFDAIATKISQLNDTGKRPMPKGFNN